MYGAVLFIHSLLRWVVLLSVLTAVAAAGFSVATKRSYGKRDRIFGLVATISVDLQLLLGLLLYTVLSGYTQAAMGNLGAAMKDRVWRFWVVEHPFAMILAVVFVHVGQVRTRRAADAKKQGTALLWFALALVVVLLGIPWPFLPYGRPLLPTVP